MHDSSTHFWMQKQIWQKDVGQKWTYLDASSSCILCHSGELGKLLKSNNTNTSKAGIEVHPVTQVIGELVTVNILDLSKAS